MRKLGTILKSAGCVVTKPFTDLADVSLLLESPCTDDGSPDGPPELNASSEKWRSDSQAEIVAASERQLTRQYSISQTDGQVRNPLPLEESITAQNPSASIPTTVAREASIDTTREAIIPTSTSRNSGEDGTAEWNPANSERNGIEPGSPQINDLPAIGAAVTARIDARKSYETISMFHGSSAIIGDVHLSTNRQTESHVLRFEDCLGRMYKLPYEQYREWSQMRTLLHRVFLPMDAFMPHITQGRFHLTGPDREIILPEFWEKAIVPGISVSMKMWPSPDLEIAAELTAPMGYRTVGAARFDEVQMGVMSLPAYPKTSRSKDNESPVYGTDTDTDMDMDKDKVIVSCRTEGNAAFAEEDYLTAITKFSEAISIKPSDYMLYLIRSRSYSAVESFEEALQDSIQAIRLNETSAAAWIQKGSVLRAMQSHHDARDVFHHVLSIEPANLRAKKELNLTEQDIRRIEDLTPESSITFETRPSSPIGADPRFEYVRLLGRGTYGEVACVREITTGNIYARKNVPSKIPGQDPQMIEQRVRNETEIMNKLRHAHIAQLSIMFKDTDHWSIFMLPVADHNLREFLDTVEQSTSDKPTNPASKMIRLWFGCLISALASAHSAMIKHEDIKPSNILVKGDMVYLTDFGTAKDFSELELSTTTDYFETGTPVYWAPEGRPWGRSADVFALGCVFAEMLTTMRNRSQKDFREYRRYDGVGFAYAYRSNLPRVRRWLREELPIDSKDYAEQTVLEQTLNMLVEDPWERLEAGRIRRNLAYEDTLFCDHCR